MRLHRFTVISGIGWLLDLGVMSGLVAAETPVFLANLASASLAITFVFFVAQKRIFVNENGFLFRKFAAYFLFQALAVPLASLAIHALAGALGTVGLADWAPFIGLIPSGAARSVAVSLLAKGLVTPATLYINFVFMGWLLERRLSYW